MHKGMRFIGQPMYGQLISQLDKSEMLRISSEQGHGAVIVPASAPPRCQ